MVLKKSFLVVCGLIWAIPSVWGASVADLERQVRASEQARIAMQQQLQQMDQDLSQMYGKLEEATNQIKELQKNQQDLYRTIDSLKEQLAKANARVQTETPSNNTKPSANVPSANDGSDKNAYQKAVDLVMVDKNYPAAIKEFKQFLEKYPNSSLVNNAHFWLAESYMKQNMFTESKQNFLVVIKDPSSNKRAESLYKLGVISGKEGNVDHAKKFYSLVLRDYEGTTTARLAQHELDKLK